MSCLLYVVFLQVGTVNCYLLSLILFIFFVIFYHFFCLQTISEVLEAADKEWQEEVKPQVILHDRLMTDAALGTAPIKAEHSYCSLVGANGPESPLDMNNGELSLHLILITKFVYP